MKGGWQATLGVRLWAVRHILLLAIASPKIVHVDEERCVVQIPLNWRTKNHLGSMYFGALCIGADTAGGLIAFHLFRERRIRASFVFKAVRAEFLKRAEGPVVFTCEDGPAIQRTVADAIATGERQETTVHVVATVPDKLGDEPIARFELTLSLKKKG